MLEKWNGITMIAGPCAAQSQEQVINTAHELKERGLSIMRASLWKPRTEPGWDGVHEQGIPWFKEAVEMGMTVATEALTPGNVDSLAKVLGDQSDQVIIWLGSRNQNHLIQQDIAKAMRNNMPNSLLMIKNQPWEDERHWLGIVDHVTSAGFPPEMIMLCHRGFMPCGRENKENLRNLPNWEMMIRIKDKTGLPMLVDPSHIGGTASKVLQVAEQALALPIDGLLVEANSNLETAKTDKNQQLNLLQLDKLLKIIISARIARLNEQYETNQYSGLW